VSIVETRIAAANVAAKEENKKAALEYMAELEAKLKADEASVSTSVKANWERLVNKRKTPQVLRQLPLTQLQ
jgi:hypothetical protein